MTASRAENAERTWAEKKARTEPSWNVFLHNDRHNPINRVVWRLWRTVPEMTTKRATQDTCASHVKGQAVAKTCHKELAELYEERHRAKGSTVSIEPDWG